MQAIALRTVLMVGILLNVVWLMVCWPLVLLELRRRLRRLGGHELLLCLFAVDPADEWALEGRDLDMVAGDRRCGIAASVGLLMQGLYWFRHRVLHVHLNRAAQWISLQHLLMLLLLLLLLLMVRMMLLLLLLRDVMLD